MIDMNSTQLKSRISSVQKSVLITLYALSLKRNSPVLVKNIRRIINVDRNNNGFAALAESNFSVSCKSLFKKGLLHKFRDERLQVAYLLTDEGVLKAEEFYEELQDQGRGN